MSKHEELNNLLPLYVSGRLDEARCRSIDAHLQTCAECRADLVLWKATAGEISRQDEQITPRPETYTRVVAQIHTGQRSHRLIRRAAEVLRSQVPLVRREIWTATACILLIGAVAAILVEHASIISFLAPMIAAASVAVLFGSEQDPSAELALSTPTSPRQILLARLVLVFSYDFLLALGISLVMVPLIPSLVLLPFVLSWLAPMAFLSALALFLSLIISAENAIAISYLVWLVQFASGGLAAAGMAQTGSSLLAFLNSYALFWKEPGFLLIGAALIGAAAIWLAGRQEFRSAPSF